MSFSQFCPPSWVPLYLLTGCPMLLPLATISFHWKPSCAQCFWRIVFVPSLDPGVAFSSGPQIEPGANYLICRTFPAPLCLVQNVRAAKTCRAFSNTSRPVARIQCARVSTARPCLETELLEPARWYNVRSCLSFTQTCNTSANERCVVGRMLLRRGTYSC